MSTSPSFTSTFKKEVLNLSSIIFIIIFSIIYFSISILLLNYKFLSILLTSNYQIQAKVNIMIQLIIGAYSSLSLFDFILLIITSILVGFNLLFIVKIIRALINPGIKLSLAVGGSSVLGIVVAGCTSCGLSLLSLLGLAGALAYIPFGAMGLHLISIALLIFSLYYSVKNYHNRIACKI